MALNPVMDVPMPAKKGLGGALGSLVGTGLGAVVGAIAGGGPGASAGASLGGQIGGAAGGVADPGKAGEPGSNVPLGQTDIPKQTVALERFQDHPAVQLAQLQEAKKALPDATQLSNQEALDHYQNFTKAEELLKQRLNIA